MHKQLVTLLVCFALQDDTVPVATSQQLFAQLPASDMALTLVNDGDHRLSRPHDLQLLRSTVNDLMRHATG
jgi:esterase/lipase